MAHAIIGTAGHIDHGKTALVKALTGIDTDTLPEEQSRGVTIDIGFAYWKEDVTIIDVPGHERFVKNMVTGVCTIDLALLVVAADDGVMPQTREHLGILNLLGVQRGLVALTKIDLVERDWIDLVVEDLRTVLEGTFLASAAIVPVSSTTGEGVEQLRTHLESEIADVEVRADRGIFRLPVDRVFSSQGFGTIVTGTVLSGSVRPRDTVALQPADRQLRVRGVQTHGREVEVAGVGSRAALNLTDVEVSEVERGDILAEPGYFSSTFMVDAELQILPDSPVSLENRTRVHLHLGPREVLARVILLESERLMPGETQVVQFRLESPGVTARGDRFVIRRYSPVVTIGGGIVLDPSPRKHRRLRPDVVAALKGLQTDDPARVIEMRLRAAGADIRSAVDLAREIGVDKAAVVSKLAELVEAGLAVPVNREGDLFAHTENWEALQEAIVQALRTYHTENPLKAGVRRDELRLQVAGRPPQASYERAVEGMISGGTVRSQAAQLALADHRIELTEQQEAVRQAIGRLLSTGRAAPPDLNELPAKVGCDALEAKSVVEAMQAMGEAVRLEESIVFDPEALRAIEEDLVAYLEVNGSVEVSAFRDLAGTTRKYAVPLLNYFDARGVTTRRGDVRILKGERTG